MTMAHDPTRSWPTGKGPDDTSIPGAAWLELLDGQAFPVVGAGTMVRDGNAWTPASSSNPLHVRAQALEQLIGALNATKETNPDAASASMLALLRGLIAIVGKEATLAQSVDKLNSILSRLEGKLDTAIFDSQGNPISAANRLPVEATLTGQIPPQVNPLSVQQTARNEPRVTTTLTTTPLGANGVYTQTPHIDTQEYVFPSGGKGVVSVSGLATSDVQGTLFLEGSDDGVSWFRYASVAVNSTNAARLRRTNIATRYIRFRYRNAETAQGSFRLTQTLWQTTDGQGNEWGQSADQFVYAGPLEPGVTVNVMNVRSAVELQELTFVATHPMTYVAALAYKDDGSSDAVSRLLRVTGTGSATASRVDYLEGDYVSQWLKPGPKHDPDNGRYVYVLGLDKPVYPMGIRVYIQNDDTVTRNGAVMIKCRLL